MHRRRLLLAFASVLALAFGAPAPASACGGEIGIRKIHYAPGSVRLSAKDRDLLDFMADLAQGGAFVRLTAHSDTAGSRARNMLLSRLRVEGASAHLVSLGVPRERIIAQSFGESRSSTALEDGRADSRHRYLLAELVSAAEARKGAAARARKGCGG